MDKSAIKENRILSNLIGKEKIESIQYRLREALRLSDSRNGSEWREKQFFPFDVKLLSASEGVSVLQPNDFTAIGGWCAIRTADLMLLKRREIADPKSKTVTKYRDASEVSDWIKNAVGIDQILDSIGIYSGSAYVAISERRLWGERIKRIVAEACGYRKLGRQNAGRIERALEDAEAKRYVATKRYIEYVKRGSVSLIRVVDDEIFDELIKVRDTMLREASVTLHDLKKLYPSEDGSIDSGAIVWGMYTGPYLEMLKAKGYVSTTNGLIIEPWLHAVEETRARKELNNRIFSVRNNRYLGPGFNKNLGFVPYMDVTMPDGAATRKSMPIGDIPNVMNYTEFIRQLRNDPNIASVSLCENPAYIWGANLLPYGAAKDALMGMVDISDSYKGMRKNVYVRDNVELVNEVKPLFKQLRKKFEIAMHKLAELVINELENALKYVFGEAMP